MGARARAEKQIALLTKSYRKNPEGAIEETQIYILSKFAFSRNLDSNYTTNLALVFATQPNLCRDSELTLQRYHL